MKLADKLCYPIFNEEGLPTRSDQQYGSLSVPFAMGLTFRERLIIALASNPVLINLTDMDRRITPLSINRIISTADTIIREMEEEK